MTRAHYLRMGTVNGLTGKETMLTCPGIIYDLVELYNQAHAPDGGRKRLGR